MNAQEVLLVAALLVVVGGVAAEVSGRRRVRQVDPAGLPGSGVGTPPHLVGAPPGAGVGDAVGAGALARPARSPRDVAAFLFGRRPSLAAWALLALVALGAAFPLVVMARENVFGAVIFGGPSLLPFVAMALVVLAAARTSRAALVVVAPGVMAQGYLGVWALADFSAQESSTASLIFVVLPFYQLGLVAVTSALAAGVHLLVRWHRSH